ncbi:hypothetical protein JF544_02650 [Halobacillus kuroshimensis]|uniref:Uncharacterized protein n=1 Tax=Halobacillus kuroshimensis TaxID=302481 RepID=A0ABS3DS01_9BACI|nr:MULTISPECIES: hypothetical protein [Halobacillus]MBN8234124.1 hypothetical protein [Halobacillus kuroshimensis]
MRRLQAAALVGLIICLVLYLTGYKNTLIYEMAFFITIGLTLWWTVVKWKWRRREVERNRT